MKKTRLILVLLFFVLILSHLPAPVSAQNPVNCVPNGDVQAILNEVTEPAITGWIRRLSGADPVTIGTSQTYIKTRYTSELFNGNPNARAYEYITQELISLGYRRGTFLEDHSYVFSTNAPLNLDPSIPDPIPQNIPMVSAKNLVLTIPGTGPNADQLVLMTAHLDSTSNKPTTDAPGAEDNASGVAALLEAARMFRYYKFDRTIKIIFFTGEEQGLHGSYAYVNDNLSIMPHILGVVNLDMFGYDSDRDMCFELHVGDLPQSQVVGNCFSDVITNYNLGIKRDYLVGSEATGRSDHAAFWAQQVGAVEVLENFFTNGPSNGCKGIGDQNPHYHRTTDTIDNMYRPATHRIAQAGIGTVASMAGPLGKCFGGDPVITKVVTDDGILISWNSLDGADSYQVYRGVNTCLGKMDLVGEVSTNSFLDTDFEYDRNYFYKVMAVDNDGLCLSRFSNCLVVNVPKPEEPPAVYYQYLPFTMNAE